MSRSIALIYVGSFRGFKKWLIASCYFYESCVLWLKGGKGGRREGDRRGGEREGGKGMRERKGRDRRGDEM